jgi:hypothetical protein
MKKYILILVMGVVTTLMSCGSGSTTTEQTDSTAVQVDSAAVSANDSTVSQIPVEGEQKPETEAVK